MTLDELDALDFAALWAGLAPDRQAAIGIAAIAEQFAGLVAADDGTDTTAADRNVALGMASEAYEGIAEAVEQAFPEVEWWDDPPETSPPNGAAQSRGRSCWVHGRRRGGGRRGGSRLFAHRHDQACSTADDGGHAGAGGMGQGIS